MLEITIPTVYASIKLYEENDICEKFVNFYQWIYFTNNNLQDLKEFKLFLKEYKKHGYKPTKF